MKNFWRKTASDVKGGGEEERCGEEGARVNYARFWVKR